MNIVQSSELSTIDISVLAQQAKLEEVRVLAQAINTKLGLPLTTQVSATDAIRLRQLAERKTATATVSASGAVVLAAPSTATHRHEICWIVVQNAGTVDATISLTGNGSVVPIICPVKGSGNSIGSGTPLMTLPANTGLTVSAIAPATGASIAVSVGYYTIDSNGVPV
jgi:hypothetical protein